MIRRPSNAGGWLIYGLIAVAVWMGWEVVKASLVVRAPPGLALSVAPNSSEALRRAAEAELGAKDFDDARLLAAEALSKAPFDARALRTVALVAASQNRTAEADALMTLAGNWSLRDSAAHAWLIQQRLRQSNYASAFAHADTLARRWTDGTERVYNLFTTAAMTDRRALQPLAAILKKNPPWRLAYVDYLVRRPDADAVLLGLGFALGRGSDTYTNEELRWIYQKWYEERRFEAIRTLRRHTGRPDDPQNLQNGDFSVSEEDGVLPFAWRLEPESGISAVMIEDDQRAREVALRVEYDGYASGTIADQLLMLPPGGYVLRGQQRLETGPDSSRLAWGVSCIETGTELASMRVPVATPQTSQWRAFAIDFRVPSSGCAVQRVWLEPVAGDRRATTIAWFDKLEIRPGPGK